MTYPVELALTVTVEVTGAVRGARGGPWEEPEPDAVDVVVRLDEVDITEALPADVLADLEADALWRLSWAATEP